MLGRVKGDAPITEWPTNYGVYLPDRVTPCPPQALPWARALRGEATDAIELYLRHDDASDGTWLSVTGRPLRDEQGELRGGVVVFRNMTQQKNAERALRQSQARYMSLVESLPLAVWSKDRNGVFTFANQLLAEVLGRPSEQIVGKTDYDFFPLEMAEQFVADDQIVIEQNRVIERVETISRADGETIFIQSFKAPQFDEEGRVIGTQGLSWDISDMKRVEAELRHAREEADAANRAKSAFLANISHEIRTPMNGVLGITELVLDTPLSSEQRGFLSLVRESADVLLEVINDILDFSKIEAGRMEMESNPFDLAEEIGDCMKALAVRAHKKGLEITYRIAPDVPTLLIGDAVRLRQVITNLAGNSIKFTLTGEIVVDITRDASIDLHDDMLTSLLVTVRDTGIGIPADKLETVFGAFEQADVSMTRKYGGTGLGLSISQRLIELMGGTVSVESIEGEGSTFTFTCHFEMQVPSYPGAPPELGEVDEKHILVVDDHPTQRAVLRELLDGWGTTPTVVDSVVAARMALDKTREGRPFDVVIIDAAMNGRSGVTLAQDVIRHGPGRPGVVLLVTAECSISDMHSSRDLGAAHYLIKPVKATELLNTIALALKPPTHNDPPSLAEADAKLHAAKTLRILLVEDSEVNQTVAVRLLERRGHEVTVVDNGAAAVELLTREHEFDVVLMDLQMPIMDGLTATAEIRRHEAEHESWHVPIIAMTAHAMKGDREKCLETGMDGYVSKPVRPKDLFDAVEGIGGSMDGVDETDLDQDSAPVVDWDAAVTRLNGDRELLSEMVEVFREEAPKLVEQIADAIRHQDAAELKISAHTLKGAVGNFVAKSAFAAALRLETLAKDGNFTEVPAAQAALEREIERLLPALDELVL
jgi:PAS domain S-box-containing protein